MPGRASEEDTRPDGDRHRQRRGERARRAHAGCSVASCDGISVPEADGDALGREQLGDHRQIALNPPISLGDTQQQLASQLATFMRQSGCPGYAGGIGGSSEI